MSHITAMIFRYTNGYRACAFPLLLLCMMLVSCAINEELMIGAGNPLTMPAGTEVRVPNNPALVAAMAGNKVYRQRHWLLGGDHSIKPSSGAEYQHALTQSLQHFLQALGIAYGAWTNLQMQLAETAYDKFLQGEITERAATKQMFEIEAMGKTVPNPNDGIVEEVVGGS
jgi:hypothetical protein